MRWIQIIANRLGIGSGGSGIGGASLSEYGKPWWTYIMFQGWLVLSFWLLLVTTDVPGLAAMLDLHEAKTLPSSVEYLVQRFIPGMMQVLYMVFLTVLLSLFAFFTLLVENLQRMIAFLLNRNLAIWLIGSTAALYMLQPTDGLLLATWTSRILYAMVTAATYYGLYRYLRQSASALFRASLGTVFLIAAAYSAYLVLPAAEFASLSDWPHLIMLGLAMVNILLFNFGAVWLIGRLLGFFVAYEYESADSGKTLLYRRMVVQELVDGVGRTGTTRYGVWFRERFSERWLTHAIRSVFALPGMTYAERMAALSPLVRMDLSRRYAQAKARYIQFRNRTNLYLAGLIALNALVLILFVLPFTPHKDEAVMIVLILVSTRLAQRTFEIGKAFYLDIMSPRPKSSTLSGGARVKLAAASIGEIVVLSAVLYAAHGIYVGMDGFMQAFESGYGAYASRAIEAGLNALMSAAAIAVFNISYSTDYFDYRSFVHLCQLFNSVVLITLSIANYLNMKKEVGVYSFAMEDGRATVYYHLILSSPGEEPRRRVVAAGADRESLRRTIQTDWEEGRIDDRELEAMLACLERSSDSSMAVMEQLQGMRPEQLDGYVRQALRTRTRRRFLLRGDTD